jgi:hypothetical protein
MGKVDLFIRLARVMARIIGGAEAVQRFDAHVLAYERATPEERTAIDNTMLRRLKKHLDRVP